VTACYQLTVSERISATVPAIPPRAALPARLLLALLDWQRRARQRGQLSCMSDAGLKDVGLSRADIASEVAKPFWIE